MPRALKPLSVAPQAPMSSYDTEDNVQSGYNDESDRDNDDDRDDDNDNDRDDDVRNDDNERDSDDDLNGDIDDVEGAGPDGTGGDRDDSSDDAVDGSDAASVGGGYRFQLVDGQVTNLQEFDDGVWRNETIGRNEKWSFDGANLIQQEFSRSGVETNTYGDSDGDGIYIEVSQPSDSITGSPTSGPEDGGYRFQVVNGQVANLQEFDDGTWKNERIDRNEKWTYDGTNLIQQETKRSGVEVTTYSDPNRDGVFTQISEIFNPFSASQNASAF